MKSALVCIAKNEDRYIEEWARYHIKLGFDKIFIFCDNWRPPDINIPNVRFLNIEINAENRQIEIYNYALLSFGFNYDFIAFFDVDEFLVLKLHKTVNELLADKKQSVAVNWILFGNNSITEDDGSLGVLNRFTKCQSKPDKHVKCIVKYVSGVEMVDPHHPNHPWLGSDGENHEDPFCESGNTDEAQLNHYFCKTYQEWKLKQSRGCADSNLIRPDSDFDRHNHNEIDDFSARNFYFDLDN